MKLSNASVAGLKLPEGKSELLVFDDTLPGFGVRLRAGGKRSWITQYRIGPQQRRLSLGTVEAVDAAEARKRAKASFARVQLGQDPQPSLAKLLQTADLMARTGHGVKRALCLGNRRRAGGCKPRCRHKQGDGGNRAGPRTIRQ